jgi:hypothetical protein
MPYPGDAGAVAEANEVAMPFVVVPELHLPVAASTHEALPVWADVQGQHLRRQGALNHSDRLAVVCIPERNLNTNVIRDSFSAHLMNHQACNPGLHMRLM